MSLEQNLAQNNELLAQQNTLLTQLIERLAAGAAPAQSDVPQKAPAAETSDKPKATAKKSKPAGSKPAKAADPETPPAKSEPAEESRSDTIDKASLIADYLEPLRAKGGAEAVRDLLASFDAKSLSAVNPDQYGDLAAAAQKAAA